MNIQLKRGVVFSEADGQSVLTGSGRRASYYRLNAVGTICLRFLLEGMSVKSAAEAVAEEYGVGVDQVLTDIYSLLRELVAAELVKVAKV